MDPTLLATVNYIQVELSELKQKLASLEKLQATGSNVTSLLAQTKGESLAADLLAGSSQTGLRQNLASGFTASRRQLLRKLSYGLVAGLGVSLANSLVSSKQAQASLQTWANSSKGQVGAAIVPLGITPLSSNPPNPNVKYGLVVSDGSDGTFNFASFSNGSNTAIYANTKDGYGVYGYDTGTTGNGTAVYGNIQSRK